MTDVRYLAVAGYLTKTKIMAHLSIDKCSLKFSDCDRFNLIYNLYPMVLYLVIGNQQHT